MRVKALVSFTYKDLSLSMYGGEVADIDDTIASNLIGDGYVEKYSGDGGESPVDLTYTINQLGDDTFDVVLTATLSDIENIVESGNTFTITCSAELAGLINRAEGDKLICCTCQQQENTIISLTFGNYPIPCVWDGDDIFSLLPFDLLTDKFICSIEL